MCPSVSQGPPTRSRGKRWRLDLSPDTQSCSLLSSSLHYDTYRQQEAHFSHIQTMDTLLSTPQRNSKRTRFQRQQRGALCNFSPLCERCNEIFQSPLHLLTEMRGYDLLIPHRYNQRPTNFPQAQKLRGADVSTTAHDDATWTQFPRLDTEALGQVGDDVPFRV